MAGLDDDLFLSIALDPADDSLRRVWADKLLEQGSAWGEFIHLQLLPQKTPAQAARERELYGLAEAWLPDVMRHAVARGSSTWERGFLTACTVNLQALKPALFHPAWATVKRLHGAPPELLASCPNLEQWTGVEPRDLGIELPKLKVLGLAGARTPRPSALAWLDRHRGLEELHLADEGLYAWYPSYLDDENSEPFVERRELQWLSPASAWLKTLRVHNGYVRVERWLEQVQRERLGFTRLACRSTGRCGWELELEQTAPGQFRRCALRTWSWGRPIDEAQRSLDLERMLRDLPDRYFTVVTLHGTRWKGYRRLACFAGAKLEVLP